MCSYFQTLEIKKGQIMHVMGLQFGIAYAFDRLSWPSSIVSICCVYLVSVILLQNFWICYYIESRPNTYVECLKVFL